MSVNTIFSVSNAVSILCQTHSTQSSPSQTSTAGFSSTARNKSRDHSAITIITIVSDEVARAFP